MFSIARKFGQQRWVLLAAALLTSPLAPAVTAQEPEVPRAFRKVFEYKFRRGEEEPGRPRLDPQDKKLYVLSGSRVEVIDWRKNNTEASASYESLPCKVDSQRILWGWTFVKNQNAVLTIYCSRLYLVDLADLHVLRTIFDPAADETYSYDLSEDGTRLVIATHPVRRSREAPRGPTEIRLLSTDKWAQLSSWSIDREARNVALSPDGEVLAADWSDSEGDKFGFVNRTGIEVRDALSGKLLAAWSIPSAIGIEEGGYIEDPRFIPGHPHLLATRHTQTAEPFSLSIWNWQALSTSRLVARIRYHESYREAVIVSPDWRWALGSVADDPGDTRYTQDFLVWDLWSGKLLYASPKEGWSIIDHLLFVFMKEGAWVDRANFEILEVSHDRRYGLATNSRWVRIYEIDASTPR